MSERVVVIGGGVSGLATAALLARGGASVTLLERHERVGGRAGRLERDGFTFDTGPSWYLMPEAFDHFYALMGTSTGAQVDLIDLDPRYRIYFEGEPATRLDVVNDAQANFRTFEALSPGDGHAIEAYVAQSTELYRMALDRFLYTTYERPTRALNADVVRQLPQLASLLTRSLDHRIGRRIDDPRLRQLLGFHAVFLGSSPTRTPSLFSLMSHLDLADGVRYPRGGLYAVIESLAGLARDQGVDLRTGANVARIEVTAGRATGVTLTSGETIPAAVVVSGADLHHTETALLAPEHRSRPERSWRRKKPGVSALMVFAGVRGELPELAHHTLAFTRDWDANFSAIMERGEIPHPASIYLSRTTATDPSTAPEGWENLAMLVPFPADPSIGAAGGAKGSAALTDHVARYLDQVGTWTGVEDLRARTEIKGMLTPAHFATELSAWQGGALGLEHSLTQSAMMRPANISSKVDNLLYAGSSTTPGIGVPLCLISAELVAKRLLGDTGVHALPTPAPQGFLARSKRADALGGIARALALGSDRVG